MAYNGVQIENSPNIIVITDSDANQITVTQPITRIIEVAALGPQGQVGPQGPSGSFDNISGSFVTTASFAAFTASINAFTASYSTGSFTGSFTGSANLLNFTASSALVTGNVTVLGTASINTLVVNQTQLSTGSNQLGDAPDDTQTLYGTVRIPTGSLTVSGSSYFTGNVGIGTANPSFILDVVGNTRTNLTSFAGQFKGDGGYANSNAFSFSGNGNIGMYFPSNVNLGFSTSGSERMRIDSSGSVGIGTTSPAYKLDIAGDTQIQSSYFLRFANEWGIQQTGTDLNIAEIGSADGRLYLKAGGNVGIGTTTPSAKLDVLGPGVFGSMTTSRGNYSNGLSLQNSAGQATSLFLWQAGIGSSHFGFPSGSSNLYIVNSYNTGLITEPNYIVLSNTGNVGIGTTTPTARLHIVGTGSTSATAAFLVRNSNLSASLVIKDDGFVGIGTTSPTGKVHITPYPSYYTLVVGRSNGYSSIKASTDDALSTTLALDSAGGATILNHYVSDNVWLVTGGGSVGVGTNTPIARLHTKGTGTTSATTALRVENANASASLVVLDNGNVYSNGSGYALTNTAFGVNAFINNTTGASNTAFGYQALYLTTGNSNTAIGSQALQANTTGTYNTAVGALALYGNTLGSTNTAIGYNSQPLTSTGGGNISLGHESLRLNTSGSNNNAIGVYALYSNITGIHNVGVGNQTLFRSLGSYNVALGNTALYNTTGSGNVAIGYAALISYSGSNSVAVGYEAAYSNTTGVGITAIGYQALKFNSGSANTALGYQAAQANTSGTAITAVGYQALLNNSGSYVTAIGNRALASNTAANDNTAVGQAALEATTTGGTNTAIGANSSRGNITGTNNTSLGSDSLRSNTAANNNVALGASALFSNTASNNVAVGAAAAYSNIIGTGITAIGYQALNANTGNNNTALGFQALLANTTATNNTAIGYLALAGATINGSNVGIGSNTSVGSSGTNNTVVGTLSNSAGYSNCVIVGSNALATAANQIVIGSGSIGINGVANTTVIGNSAITLTSIPFGALIVNTTSSLSATLGVRSQGSTSATNAFALQNASSTTLLRIRDDGQHTYSGPLLILPASQSAYVISQSISSSNTVGGQVYGVNITPTFWQTTASQTETAFRVAATFTQSSTLATAGTNIIADFGASSVGSQLTVTDVTSGSIYMVNDVSGLPIIEATSDWTVNMYNFPSLVFQKTGSQVNINGTLRVSGSFILPLSQSVSPQTGSAYWSGSLLFVWDGTRYRSSSFA